MNCWVKGVYLAVRRGSDRPVAIKLHTGPLDSGGNVQRATRELDLLSGIRHPHVVNVLDYGMYQGQLWIATEFVDGTPLDARCADNSFSTRQRVELLAKVCDAVQSLHEFGVIHRDLKPANILIDESGQPVIIDLGIASLIGGDVVTTLTQEGSPIGTPAFMAPEQARGERATISTRSDVYSLGAIGYLLLTGDTPHPGDATIHELIRRVAQDEPRDARLINSEIPKGLAAIIGKAVQRVPAVRYSSSAEFASDLRRWLAGEHVAAIRPSRWARISRWIGRHPALSTAVICITIIALTTIGAVLTTWQLNQRPFQVTVDTSHGRWARVLTATGRILREWRSNEDDGVMFAEVMTRHDEFGGGKVILTVIRSLDGHPELDSQLCVWDFEHPDRLLWHTSGTAPFITAPPGPLPPLTSSDFLNSAASYTVGRFALIKDVFSESPGDEIVVVHSHHSVDPHAIRIYSADGEVLYEAWHWGAVSRPLWLPEPRLLVLQARDNVKRWEHLGRPDLPQSFPLAIFTLSPEFGQILGWTNGPSADESISIGFYKYLLPPETEGFVNTKLVQSADPARRQSQFDLTFTVRTDLNATMIITFDAAGERALNDPKPNGPFRQLQNPPHLEDIRLGEGAAIGRE